MFMFNQIKQRISQCAHDMKNAQWEAQGIIAGRWKILIYNPNKNKILPLPRLPFSPFPA